MKKSKPKVIKYPANLMFKKVIKSSGFTVGFVAKTLKVSRHLLSETINGHRKSVRLVDELTKFLSVKG